MLRGGAGRPNYLPEDVRETVDRWSAAALPTGLVTDASDGNSDKEHERQAVVARETGAQVAAGDTDIRGVMLEGFLLPGRQELGLDEPVFGQSLMDACMGWETTAAMPVELAAAARGRRHRTARAA